MFPQPGVTLNLSTSKTCTMICYQIASTDSTVLFPSGYSREIELYNVKVYGVNSNLSLDVAYDKYASETSFQFVYSNLCTTLLNKVGTENNSTETYQLEMLNPGLYLFRAKDAYGDGMLNTFGYTIKHTDGQVVERILGNFGRGFDRWFYSSGVAAEGYVIAGEGAEHGSVEGSDTVAAGDTVVLTAIPDEGYHFVGWESSTMQSNDNPLTIVASPTIGHVILRALFEINTYRVSSNALRIDDKSFVPINNETYEHGQSVAIMALPQGNSVFSGWSNGQTVNPYQFTIVSDTTVNAIYNEAGRDTVHVFDTIVIRDTINHYVYDTTHLVHIDTLHHYQYDTTRVFDTLVVTHYDTTHFTHTLYDTTNTVQTVYDTTHAYHTLYDTTAVTHYVFDSTFVYDTTTVTHYVFDSTWVFDTVYLFDTIHLHDTVYVEVQGIEDAAATSVRIYTNHTEIVVEGAEGLPVSLYDINGRKLDEADEGFGVVRFNAPASGTYLLRIGSRLTRKVVVVR